MRTLDSVLMLLEGAGVQYRHIRHPPARDAGALAAARGLPISAGVKALVLRARGRYAVLALRADRRADNRLLRRALGAQKLRFARLEELAALGLAPGQVPPLGEPVLPARLLADEGIWGGEVVAFTAGTHTDSLVLATADWARLAAPERARFSAGAVI